MLLHEYQTRAVKHLHTHPRAALFLDMGLGKTAIALSALTPAHLPVLVVAPKRVAETVWSAEAALWRPDLSVAVAAGSPAARAKVLASTPDVTVIGRENIRDVKRQYRTVIIDELSGFKDRSTVRWKAARRLVSAASHVWGLTGTPSPNSLLDLWAEMFLIDRGERLGTSLGRYRERYFRATSMLPSGVVTSYEVRPGASARIQEKLADICVSMSKKDWLTLPPVTHNTVRVGMPDAAWRAYSDMLTDFMATVEVLGVQAIHSAANAAILTGRLSQITAGFMYSDPVDPKSITRLHYEKMQAVHEIVDGTGAPVLVFYNFVEEADNLEKEFPSARRIGELGVIEQWNRGEVPLLLAHPAAASHGLNLQYGGNVIVFTTLPWSLEYYEQSIGRLDRQGQTKPVIVHTITVPGTVDEAIVDRLRNKKDVQDALLHYLKEK